MNNISKCTLLALTSCGLLSGPTMAQDTAAPAGNLPAIRAPFRDEVTQQWDRNDLSPFVLFLQIENSDTGRVRARYLFNTQLTMAPKRSQQTRGAEVLPGNYRLTLACYHYGSGMTWSKVFDVPITARAGFEYVPECLGYFGNNGNLHVVVTEKPRTELSNGVMPLAEKCSSLWDVSWMARIHAKNCGDAD